MAKALALPAGQALFLNGNVAPSLLYKLNPWAKDPAVEHAVLATLPDINQIMRGNIGQQALARAAAAALRLFCASRFSNLFRSAVTDGADQHNYAVPDDTSDIWLFRRDRCCI